MSLTGLKLSQINGAQEPLKDTDLFYYVTQSPGPIFDSKKGDVKLIREYVDATVGQTLRDEFILADSVVKTHAETIVAQEEASRVAADAVLTQSILDEATARTEAILAEKAERMAAVNAESVARTAQIATETANRTAADADILEAVSSEATSRASADASITAALADEVSARAVAEAAITATILEEETARTAAIATVQASLSTEATTRLNADTKLTTDLSAEVSNRIAAVSAEQAARVAADNVLTSAVATVQANVSAESTARINADAQLTTNLAKETEDRIEAVSDEATLRQTADTKLTTDLATEVQNRQTAITQEASSRTALQNTINASLALKADLVSGKIPASQLPSYVDDVIEVILYTDLPSEGEAGKIYVVKNTNLTYRWTGTDYTEISKSLAIGETDSTAYRGDRGKIAYDHTLVIAGNPHGTTKAHVGLGNADNTSDLSKPVSTATQAALDLKVNKSDTYVKTVNTQSGDVVLTKASISLGNVDNTSDLNKPISTATQAALDLKVTIPAPIQHTTAGDYSNTTSRRALRLTDATDRPITIDLATVPKNSGIVLTLTDISTNITDKLTTKTVKQLLVFKDTAGVVTEAAGTVGVSIAGQVVSVVYKGIAAKVIKTLITVNVEVLSEDNAVA